MQIPIVILCGTQPERRLVRGDSFSCPVCNEHAVRLVEDAQRFCFCFLPLCLVGTPQQSAICGFCGARMPASIVSRAPLADAAAPPSIVGRAPLAGTAAPTSAPAARPRAGS